MSSSAFAPKHKLLTTLIQEIYPANVKCEAGSYFFVKRREMRVPNVIKDLVAFLCVERDGRYHYGGTAFFISAWEGNKALAYVVTARHNIDHASQYGDLYLRANTKEGKGKTIKVHGEWIFPENAAIDLAIKPISPEFREFNIGVLPGRLFVTDQLIEDLDIGIGDDLMVVGLFANRYGTEKNLPIIRVGHIASMPDEAFEDVASGFKFDAYLAELRSLGGLSGSPVLVVPSGGKRNPTEVQSYLIGLIRGHWNLKRPASALDFSNDELVAINTGIAQVTPIQELTSLLNRDDVAAHRRVLIRQIHGDGSGLVLD